MRKKRKLKVGILVGLAVFLIAVMGAILIFLKIQGNNRKEMIEKHYGNVVQVSKDTKLFRKEDANYRAVGTLYEGTILSLEEKEKTTEEGYFLLKDTAYYVFYEDVERKEIEEDTSYNYLVFNENANLKSGTTLYQNEQKILEITENMVFPIVEKNDKTYRVSFQNKIYEVTSDRVENTQEATNTTEEEATHIPILHYGVMDEEKIKTQLGWIKELGYETITWDEWNRWQKEEIRLPKKRVLLLFDVLDQKQNTWLDEGNYKRVTISETGKTEWVHQNQSSTKGEITKIPTYKMTSELTKEDISKMLEGTMEKIEEESLIATKVAVLNYHFFYDGNVGNNCNETICLDSRKFEQHLQYLKENGFKTVTMEEYRAWIYDEINLPKKSVLITIDDGAAGTSKINGNILIPMLEKYDLKGTLFLITAWWDLANYQSPNLEVESHGYDIHVSATCDGESKAKALCLSKEDLVTDLNKSIDILGTKIAFCYPFYAYNNTVIEATKESGFALGFAGGNYKSTKKSNKYAIPRYPIYDSITMNQFINMVN